MHDFSNAEPTVSTLYKTPHLLLVAMINITIQNRWYKVGWNTLFFWVQYKSINQSINQSIDQSIKWAYVHV